MAMNYQQDVLLRWRSGSQSHKDVYLLCTAYDMQPADLIKFLIKEELMSVKRKGAEQCRTIQEGK